VEIIAAAIRKAEGSFHLVEFTSQQFTGSPFWIFVYDFRCSKLVSIAYLLGSLQVTMKSPERTKRK